MLAGARFTVTEAVPDSAAFVAVMTYGPPAVEAVNRPEVLMPPPPLVLQPNDAGCGLVGWPN